MLCSKHVSFYLKDCSDNKCNSCPGGADFNVDNECPNVFECTDRATSCSNNGNCNAAADACDCDENFEGIDCSIQSKYLGYLDHSAQRCEMPLFSPGNFISWN